VGQHSLFLTGIFVLLLVFTGCDSRPQPAPDGACVIDKPEKEKTRIVSAARTLQLGQSQSDVVAVLGLPDHVSTHSQTESQYDYILKQCNRELLQWTEGTPPEVISAVFRDGKLVGTRSNVKGVPPIGSVL